MEQSQQSISNVTTPDWAYSEHVWCQMTSLKSALNSHSWTNFLINKSPLSEYRKVSEEFTC